MSDNVAEGAVELTGESDPIEVREVTFAKTGKGSVPWQFTAKAATMVAIVRDLGVNKQTSVRQAVARQLSQQYPGANPQDDHETDIAVEVSDKSHAALIDVVGRLGLEASEVEYEAPARPEKAPSKRQSSKTPRDCECGCGGKTGGGRFIPGHDMKLKSQLLKRVDGEADQDAADKMVANGWSTSAVMEERIARAQAKLANAQVKATAEGEAAAA